MSAFSCQAQKADFFVEEELGRGRADPPCLGKKDQSTSQCTACLRLDWVHAMGKVTGRTTNG